MSTFRYHVYALGIALFLAGAWMMFFMDRGVSVALIGATIGVLASDPPPRR